MVSRVYAIGGSVIKKHFDRMDELANAVESDEQLAVVVGAGHLKKHQEAVRGHVNKAETDMVGIAATRLNARTLSALMDDSHPSIPETVEEVKEIAASGKDIVMGGLNPGFSTDAVAAVVAELFDAELFIATDVDGIYTGDPCEDENAEKLDTVEASKLIEMTMGKNEPGVYSVVDGTAVQIIDRSDISSKVFEGTLENLRNPWKSEGTEIICG